MVCTTGSSENANTSKSELQPGAGANLKKTKCSDECEFILLG